MWFGLRVGRSFWSAFWSDISKLTSLQGFSLYVKSKSTLTQSVREWVSQSVTRSPIERFWTAKMRFYHLFFQLSLQHLYIFRARERYSLSWFRSMTALNPFYFWRLPRPHPMAAWFLLIIRLANWCKYCCSCINWRSYIGHGHGIWQVSVDLEKSFLSVLSAIAEHTQTKDLLNCRGG